VQQQQYATVRDAGSIFTMLMQSPNLASGQQTYAPVHLLEMRPNNKNEQRHCDKKNVFCINRTLQNCELKQSTDLTIPSAEMKRLPKHSQRWRVISQWDRPGPNAGTCRDCRNSLGQFARQNTDHSNRRPLEKQLQCNS
jgi:hypothetical protein